MIDEDVDRFCAEYLHRLAAAVVHSNPAVLSGFCGQLSDALRAGGRRLFAVGNGGSSAIARAGLFQARLRVSQHRLPVAVVDVGDQHEVTYWTGKSGYRSALSDMLVNRGLASGDTVLIVSISGRSPNVLAAAERCREYGARMLALTGGDGAEVAELASSCVSTGVADHQISEDIVLVWLTLLIDAAATGRFTADDLAAAANRAAGRIRELARNPALPGFLRRLTTAITQAMQQRRATYVVCGDGGALGLLAEHFAHNLHWDVATGAGLPTPLVLGPASLADLTAIHNDHNDPAHGLRHMLESTAAGDVICGIDHNSTAAPLRDLLRAPARHGAGVFLLTTTTGARPGAASELPVAAADPWELSTVVQPTMHVLCRLIAQRITDAEHGADGSSLQELLDFDLCARRRLVTTSQGS